MIILYSILGLFLVVSGLFSYSGVYNGFYVNTMAQNVCSELIGIILTLVLVDKILDWNKAKEAKRMQKISMKYLRNDISKHLRMLCRMYKAGIEKENCPNKNIHEMRDFFNESFFDVVITINHNKKVPDITEDYTYLEYVKNRCDELTAGIQKTLRLYEKYFDSNIIEKMEDITESDFIRIVNIFDRGTKLKTPPFCNSTNFLGSEDGIIETSFKTYVSDFLWLVDYYNKITDNTNPIKFKTEMWDVHPLHYGGAMDPLIEHTRISMKRILNNN